MSSESQRRKIVELQAENESLRAQLAASQAEARDTVLEEAAREIETCGRCAGIETREGESEHCDCDVVAAEAVRALKKGNGG